ncbi:hypothetical protein DVZ84_35730 [Streptomyces parvulus]|uniref:Uncharacterized protein n=2 Tax=Streptomyces parvulus TaxID=146923 RepID=A0A369UX79_9ACTN|nr:hypothetical protein DVZ84_35730 [Streptomyces parvulus]
MLYSVVMEIPDHLIDAKRELDAAEARYRFQTGMNATIALAAWSDCATAYNRALGAYSARHNIPAPALRQAIEESINPLAMSDADQEA